MALGAAATRAQLAAVSSTAAGDTYLLAESGSEGTFVLDNSDLSAQVSADALQGIYVDPSSTNGSSGAWVRRHDGRVRTEWWGALGDCTAPGAGTNDLAAFDAARSYLSRIGTSTIQLAGKHYRIAPVSGGVQRLAFTEGVKMEGVSFHENPGIVGGVSYSGVNAFDDSILVFDTNQSERKNRCL